MAWLRSALVWAGLNPLPGGGFGRFAIKAQTTVVGGTIGLSGVNVELDGNTAEGVLTFATDGRQTLQGTLAADQLNLSPYISTVRLLTAIQRSERFAEGSIEGALTSGLMQAALTRLRRWYDDERTSTSSHDDG